VVRFRDLCQSALTEWRNEGQVTEADLSPTPPKLELGKPELANSCHSNGRLIKIFVFCREYCVAVLCA